MWLRHGLLAVAGALALLEGVCLGAIPLPELGPLGGMPLEQALASRRSVRSFGDEPLSLFDLSRLLWAAGGTTHPRGYRTAPSAGALYPVDVYAVVRRVHGLTPGVYLYRPLGHSLEPVKLEEVSRALSSAALGQAWVEEAPLCLVVVAFYDRSRVKYGERGVRYSTLEAGHVAQNVLLQAVSLGLGAVPVGAFRDGEVISLLGLPRGASPLYIIPVGRPKS